MTWQQIPFVRLLIPFLAGIYAYSWQCNYSPTWLFQVGLYSFFCLILFLGYYKKAPSIDHVRLWGLVLVLTLFQLGYLRSYMQDDRNTNTHLQHQDQSKLYTYWAIVQAPPKINAKSIKTILKLQGILDTTTNWQPCTGKLLAYIQLDSNSSALQYGDQLLLKAPIQALSPPLNPQAFDLRKYYAPKNIYQKTYCSSHQWAKLPPSTEHKDFYHYIYSYRNYLLGILQQHLNTPNEYAVAAALILGAKNQLNPQIRNAYADTGAMHVLAVSGLHIGILASLLGFLLGLGQQNSFYKKRWRALFLLAFIWGFAFLTGASASVLRACTMFSFVIIGQLFRQKINIYNALAASAFLLLCINPLMLLDIGFQLSYIALIGILYLHPKIYQYWTIKQQLFKWVWNGLALAIAAQIATLPISLYYFHQFPLFFWLSSIVVGCTASIILSLGLCLFCFNAVPILGKLLGGILYSIVWITNSLIFAIQKLPGAVWEGFWLEYWQLCIWYLLLISSIYVLLKRQLKWSMIPLSCLLLLASAQGIKQYQQYHQQQLCIYHSHKGTLFSFINGNHCLSWADSNLIKQSKLSYIQQNHLWSMGINQQAVAPLEKDQIEHDFYYQNQKGQFLDKRLALYNAKMMQQKSYNPLKVNYVLVCDNPPLKSIQQIEDVFLYDTLIFDASNSTWNIRQWTKECKHANIHFVDISQQGAWIINW